jgi:catechol 2,3-dioxygenase-like lactoylglutathione lyase family enzyme
MISGLGHVGIHVHDLEVSREFYCGLLGLVVTDESPELGMVFLSAQPEVEHHELLLCGGRNAPPGVAVIQQISFRCEQLADVIGFYRRLRDASIEIDMVVSHGNAIGMYFFDPDHNRCEVYWPTGRLARQPYLEGVDLDRPIDELLAELDASVDQHGAAGYVDPVFAAAQGLR